MGVPRRGDRGQVVGLLAIVPWCLFVSRADLGRAGWLVVTLRGWPCRWHSGMRGSRRAVRAWWRWCSPRRPGNWRWPRVCWAPASQSVGGRGRHLRPPPSRASTARSSRATSISATSRRRSRTGRMCGIFVAGELDIHFRPRSRPPRPPRPPAGRPPTGPSPAPPTPRPSNLASRWPQPRRAPSQHLRLIRMMHKSPIAQRLSKKTRTGLSPPRPPGPPRTRPRSAGSRRRCAPPTAAPGCGPRRVAPPGTRRRSRTPRASASRRRCGR